jgi:hypothetical protein
MKIQLLPVAGVILAALLSVTPASAFVAKPPTSTPDVVLVHGGHGHGFGHMHGNRGRHLGWYIGRHRGWSHHWM